MDWEKVIKKGLEGAIVGGGAGGAVSQDLVSTIIAAAMGFIFRAGRNWWKHK